MKMTLVTAAALVLTTGAGALDLDGGGEDIVDGMDAAREHEEELSARDRYLINRYPPGWDARDHLATPDNMFYVDKPLDRYGKAEDVPEPWQMDSKSVAFPEIDIDPEEMGHQKTP
ncbi:MAG: hypothetical protein LIP77_03800 [Planctomycetes bacterium]|nr:hypothetical protein [Planctomycetota bacterium]